jgi:specificity subunit
LTFNERVKWLPLGEILKSLNTGLNPRHFFKLNTEDASNFYVTIKEIKGGSLCITSKTDRINDEALELCNNRSNLEVGDVLFSGTGTIGETYEIRNEPYNWNIKEGVYSLKPDSSKVNSTFLSHILKTTSIKKCYANKAAGGTVKSVPMSELKKISIPVPTLEEQRKITEILDKFEKLTNDISVGLPAEIESRRKQYEYYRNKLLTFKELECSK